MLSTRTALLFAALALAGCDIRVGDKGDVSVDITEGKAEEAWARTYTVTPGGRLEIINVDGTIEVQPATGNSVEVRARRESRAGSDEAARELLATAEIVEEVAAGHVKIEARPIKRDGARSFGRRPRVSVEYKVLLPPGLTASFHTQNGAVRLDNVNGKLDAATTNGTITGRDVAGSITAATVNGGVQMGLSAVSGDVLLTAVNGSIRVELPATIDAQLEATTVNGGVSVDEALGLTAAERTRQRVTGRINKGGRRIAAQTTNGGVRVMVRAPRAE
jgi:hypothetical protein